ncbi:hypothetical protein MTR_1g109410 [Medicago truncatula]|uniref:Uncharacterized protein n=1 Tax=Medicago truncatula TaxID=3880 RepID=A0A072VQU4_MEDTR|nr:hypothetical protein MTR_1g109410 [Medicago truncatula]
MSSRVEKDSYSETREKSKDDEAQCDKMREKDSRYLPACNSTCTRFDAMRRRKKKKKKKK